MRTVLKTAVLSLAVVLLALPASAFTATDGMDVFTTPADGQTTVNLANFPLGIFGQGATASPSVVQLKGQPIAGLGKTDTVVHRINDMSVPSLGSSDWTPIELVGLRLVSIGTVSIFANGQTHQWNLEVGLSDNAASTGIMTVTRSHAEGGTFSTRFTVKPRLRFSRSGAADVIIDCGSVSCNSMSLSSSNSPWVVSGSGFNPGSAGVPSIGNGTSFDGDGDGVADDSFAGGTNFYAGFNPATYVPAPLNHDHPPVAAHKQVPNTQCKTTAVATASSTATEDTEVEEDVSDTSPTPSKVLCAAVAEPTDPVSTDRL